jgi:TRAP-type transport system periplasmic protein
MKNRMLMFTLLISLGLILIISLTGACSKSTTTTNPTPNASPTAASQSIKLRMGTPFPAMHPLEQINKKWIEKIQNDTNGRVRITLYSTGTLIDMFGAWDELQQGVADIANIATAVPGTPFKISAIMDMYFYGIDYKDSRKVWNELWKEFPEISAEYAKVKRLYAFGGPSQYIHTSDKPIRTLADFQGMQIVPPASFPGLLEKLGATGSALPMMEIYNALDKNIVEGTFGPLDALKNNNYGDVTKFSTDMHMVGSPVTFYAMNLNSWNSLPPDIQKVFEDSFPWVENEIDNTLEQIEQKDGIDYAKAKGHELIELSAGDQVKYYKILDEIALNKAKELDSEGLPGTKIFQETRRLIGEYSK